ncbi:MAG: restriction endonuclease subunit S [Finegoldia magna]
MEFKKVTLGEISVNSRGYYGIGASAVDFDPNLPTYLRITDINDDGSINKDNLKSIKEEDYEKYILKENDIVFARTGNSTGRNYFYEKKDGLFVFAGFLIKFSLDKEKVFPKYIKYVCQSKEYWGWINSIATGSTRKNINAKMYEKMPIFLPEEKTQEKIVTLLESLDSKIEINNKIISNLESQAQAIFKSWFVDFEPFQDGDFVESELGMIPEGWEVKELGELFKFVKGKKPKDLHEKYEDNFIPYIVKGVMDGSETPKFTNEINIVEIKKLDCFMLMDGANSGNIYYGYDGALGSTFALLESKNQVYRELIYWKLKTNESIIKNQNTGSAIPHANKDFINKMNVAIPINIEENEILKTLENFRIKINLLNNQNTKLAELRDALLPKLMAGEIDVSNIKIEGEEVKNE